MKKKEIEVWVDEENIESNSDEIMIWHKVSKLQAKHLIKATLIIELPEKKIELTESQFDEAWVRSFQNPPCAQARRLRQKLFGGDNDN